MAPPDPPRPQPTAAFRSWLPHEEAEDAEDAITVYVALNRAPPILENLAQDWRFRYRPGKSFGLAALKNKEPRAMGRNEAEGTGEAEGRAAKRMKIGSASRPSNLGSGSTPLTRSTSTATGTRARELLRAWGFDLVALGIGISQSSASLPPFTELDSHPAPSLVDASVERVFRQSARAVDDLLSALDQARTWTPGRLSELFLEAGGSSNELAHLYVLFGHDLSADLNLVANQPIGGFLGFADFHESVFNKLLDANVVQVVNAVLRLVGVAGGASPQAPAPQSVEESDRRAATLLLSAVRRLLSDLFLRLIDTDSDQAALNLPQHILRCTRPDWVLTWRSGGEAVVCGVIESKPHADRAALVDLCTRRRSPLVPSAATEAAPSPAAAPEPPLQQRRQRPQRLAAPRNLQEPSEPSALERSQEAIMPDPSKAPQFGYLDGPTWRRMALQLCSQLALYDVRNGLLWAEEGRALLPILLTQATWDASDAPGDARNDRRQFALVCAPSALSVAPPPTPLAAPDETTPTSPLTFHDRPNVIMGIVKWAIWAFEDAKERGGPRPDGMSSPFTATLPGGPDDGPSDVDRRQSGSRGPGRQQDRSQDPGQEDGAPRDPQGSGGDRGPRDGADLLPASSSSESMAAIDTGSCFSRPDEPCRSSPPSSPVGSNDAKPSKDTANLAPPMREPSSVVVVPFACGGFADVHRGTIRRPGLPDQPCVWKFNRPSGWGRPAQDASWDDEDGPGSGALDRFQRELDVLEALGDLQGDVVPRLLGTSRTLSQGRADYPPSLILEDVGQRIDEPSAWPKTMPLEERRRLVQRALGRLHDAGWIHGDIGARNILVSSSATKDGEEEKKEGPAPVRVCLVDLVRAQRGSPEDFAFERRQLDELLEDIF